MISETDKKAINMLKKGFETNYILKRLKISTNRLSELRRSLIDFDKEIAPYMKQGLSLSIISALTGYHTRTIQALCKDRNIPNTFSEMQVISITLPKSIIASLRKYCAKKNIRLGKMLSTNIIKSALKI